MAGGGDLSEFGGLDKTDYEKERWNDKIWSNCINLQEFLHLFGDPTWKVPLALYIVFGFSCNMKLSIKQD